jgi:type IV secretory pathway VirJ component
MLKNMEKQKEAIKEKMNQRIDEYFAEFEKGSNEPRFTINDIERLMLDNQRKMREMMTETTGELASSVGTEYKKNVQNAEEY